MDENWKKGLIFMQIFHRFIIDALIKVLCGKNWIQVFDKFAVPFQSVMCA